MVLDGDQFYNPDFKIKNPHNQKKKHFKKPRFLQGPLFFRPFSTPPLVTSIWIAGDGITQPFRYV